MAWLNNGLPADVCAREPSLWDYGFYRKLNDGQIEFLAFCKVGTDGKPISEGYTAFKNEDLEKLLDGLVPKPKRVKP